jgi:proprotein convertase subtilisin/kexin type 5
MLDGTVTDQVEARALSFNIQYIDIYSASWGPEDDGKTVDGPGRLAKRAFLDGIRHGRNKLGSIYVWASGNGGRRFDNCNCDGYTNSIYTLSISSATQAGTKPWYLEECSSTLASTYSSGTPGKDANVVTVDMDVSFMSTGHQDQSLLCTKSHTGTSASAPIAAAMCALVLEANPKLTWRDMQHLVVITSRHLPLAHEPGWAVNGVGRRFSHKFGYGLMDGEALVKNSEKWINVPEQELCESTIFETKLEIPLDSNRSVESIILTNGCNRVNGKVQTGENGKEINYLEHVQAKITLKFRPRGNLKISLISPKGTESHLLLPRPRDLEESNFNAWPFLSVHFWGENPQGQWTLRVRNAGDSKALNGYLQSWGLVFYGTTNPPIYPSFNQTKRRRSVYLGNSSLSFPNRI